MLKEKRVLMIGFFITLAIFSFSVNAIAENSPKIYYGKVVGTEFSVIQVRGDDGRISWFWMGHRTHLESRIPFFGDRVRIEYVKDRLGRNAVTRIKVLK
jgi:hypothetical protein